MSIEQYEDFKIPGHEVTVPVMLLHGKKYMQVPQRLIWFNLEKQDWTIETEIEREWTIGETNLVRYKCTIKDPAGRIMRLARKTKEVHEDKDYDSCETGAVGRCLLWLGYGTAFSGEEETEEIVDAPQVPSKIKQKSAAPKQVTVNPAVDHPFSENLATSGVYVNKKFQEIFRVEQAMGFERTLKMHQQQKEGAKVPDWVIDYLVYVTDSGIKLD